MPLFTQLQLYAVHRTCAGGGRATQIDIAQNRVNTTEPFLTEI
jgi:hypothetical protein